MGYLSSMDNAFKAAFAAEYDAAEVTQGSVVLPKGRYQLVVTDVSITDRNNLNFADDREADEIYDCSLQFTFEVVNDCPYKGSTVRKWHGICLKSVKGLKADLQALGCEFAGLDKLEQDVESGAMIGIVVDSTVTEKKAKTGDKVYSNIWLNKAVGLMDVATKKHDTFTAVEDDDLPPWMR